MIGIQQNIKSIQVSNNQAHATVSLSFHCFRLLNFMTVSFVSIVTIEHDYMSDASLEISLQGPHQQIGDPSHNIGTYIECDDSARKVMVPYVLKERIGRTVAQCKVEINGGRQAEGRKNSQLIYNHSGECCHLVLEARPHVSVPAIQGNRTHGDYQQMLVVVQVYLEPSDAVKMGETECHHSPKYPCGPAGVQFASEVSGGGQQKHSHHQQGHMAGVEYKYSFACDPLEVESQDQGNNTIDGHYLLEQIAVLGGVALLLLVGESVRPLPHYQKVDDYT